MHIKLARQRMGYTLLQASGLLGISTRTLSNYEKGATTPNFMITEKMKKLYKMRELEWGITVEEWKEMRETNLH